MSKGGKEKEKAFLKMGIAFVKAQNPKREECIQEHLGVAGL